MFIAECKSVVILAHKEGDGSVRVDVFSDAERVLRVRATNIRIEVDNSLQAPGGSGARPLVA